MAAKTGVRVGKGEAAEKRLQRLGNKGRNRSYHLANLMERHFKESNHPDHRMEKGTIYAALTARGGEDEQ